MIVLRCCDLCACRLAGDNAGTRCSPCDSARRYAPEAAAPATAIGLRALTRTWPDGFDAFRRASGLDVDGAAELAVSIGLAPGGSLLSAARLAELARSREIPTTELAARWGVSRWTVATWRRSVGLERRIDAGRATPAPPVSGVEVHRGDPTRLVTGQGPVRLGRSARAFVAALAEAHPDALDERSLLARVFPDAPPDRAAALHAVVSRLRRHLPPGTIRREGDAYRLAIEADSITGRGRADRTLTG